MMWGGGERRGEGDSPGPEFVVAAVVVVVVDPHNTIRANRGVHVRDQCLIARRAGLLEHCAPWVGETSYMRGEVESKSARAVKQREREFHHCGTSHTSHTPRILLIWVSL